MQDQLIVGPNVGRPAEPKLARGDIYFLFTGQQCTVVSPAVFISDSRLCGKTPSKYSLGRD